MRDRLAGRQRLKRQQDVEELIQGIDNHGAALAAEAAPNSDIRDERAGVGNRGLFALAHLSADQDDNRLFPAGCPQDIEKGAPVANILSVQADHPSVRVGKKIFDEFGGMHVDAVVCAAKRHRITFNLDSNRFISVFLLGYVGGIDGNDNMPTMSGGTCEKN